MINNNRHLTITCQHSFYINSHSCNPEQSVRQGRELFPSNDWRLSSPQNKQVDNYVPCLKKIKSLKYLIRWSNNRTSTEISVIDVWLINNAHCVIVCFLSSKSVVWHTVLWQSSYSQHLENSNFIAKRVFYFSNQTSLRRWPFNNFSCRYACLSIFFFNFVNQMLKIG